MNSRRVQANCYRGFVKSPWKHEEREPWPNRARYCGFKNFRFFISVLVRISTGNSNISTGGGRSDPARERLHYKLPRSLLSNSSSRELCFEETCAYDAMHSASISSRSSV